MSNCVKPDLCVVTDATGSMGRFLEAIRQALPQINGIVGLLDIVDKIGILSYHDYCDSNVHVWSGWHNVGDEALDVATSKLQPMGGGDIPEAAKTAVAKLLEYKRPNVPVITIWFADAPPHHPTTGGDNFNKEKEAFATKTSDWVKLCNYLSLNDVTVYSILNTPDWAINSFFAYMSAITNGQLFIIPSSSNSNAISSITINLILALVGAEYKNIPNINNVIYENNNKISVINNKDTIKDIIKDENDNGGFMPSSTSSRANRIVVHSDMKLDANKLVRTDLNNKLTLFDTSSEYQKRVYDIFMKLIDKDTILALTENPLFGLFWRAICSRRKDDRRAILLAQISKTLSLLPQDTLAIVKKWLDDSYNRIEEIEKQISECSPLFPALVLDTTEIFKAQELLEITYSCNADIMRRVSSLIVGLRVITEAPKK